MIADTSPRNCRSWHYTWDVYDEFDRLPVDHTRNNLRLCLAPYSAPPWTLVCTRQLGHTGRHAAGNGARILAVWK